MTHQPLTPEQRQKYLADRGKYCPYCGHHELHAGPVDADGPVGWSDVECLKCHETWVDEYTLTDVMDESDDEEDKDVGFPWCDACKSYHHPKNLSCKNPNRRGDHGPAAPG